MPEPQAFWKQVSIESVPLNYTAHFQYWSLPHRRTKLRWKPTSGAYEQSTTKECWLLCRRSSSLDGRRQLRKHLAVTSRIVLNVQRAFGEDIFWMSTYSCNSVIPYFCICLAHSVSGKIVVSTHRSSFIWKQTFVYPLWSLFIRLLDLLGRFLHLVYRSFFTENLKTHLPCTVQSDRKLRCVSIR